MTCTMCLWNYPEGLVNPLITPVASVDLCGICALELSNELHGIRRKQFDGPKAEEIRLGCVKWRKDNADQKPVMPVVETSTKQVARTLRAGCFRRPSKRLRLRGRGRGTPRF